MNDLQLTMGSSCQLEPTGDVACLQGYQPHVGRAQHRSPKVPKARHEATPSTSPSPEPSLERSCSSSQSPEPQQSEPRDSGEHSSPQPSREQSEQEDAEPGVSSQQQPEQQHTWQHSQPEQGQDAEQSVSLQQHPEDQHLRQQSLDRSLLWPEQQAEQAMPFPEQSEECSLPLPLPEPSWLPPLDGNQQPAASSQPSWELPRSQQLSQEHSQLGSAQQHRQAAASAQQSDSGMLHGLSQDHSLLQPEEPGAPRPPRI